MNQVPALIRVFGYLSLLTVGGGMAAFPELKILTVDVHHWVTFKQLIHLYSIGQLSPGPNMMMVASIGEFVAGVPGAIIVAATFFLPTALLTFIVGRVWVRMEGWPWRTSIQKGLAPVSIGLLLAGFLAMAEGAVVHWTGWAIAGAACALLLVTRINPALLVLAGAVIGLFVYGGN